MKKLLIILGLLISLYSQGQRIIVNGHRYSNPPTARFNFSRPANVISGYNNMVASAANTIGNLSVTDPTTGWTLITNVTQWEPYFGSVGHLTNGDGGNISGTSSTNFTQAAMSCGFLQAGHTFATSGGTIGSDGGAPFEFTNLPAGSYTITVISAIKSTVNNNLPNAVWYFKFGSSATTNQTISQQADNLTELSFTGSISTGERIRFGPFTTSEDVSGTAAVANCIKITKN